MATRQSDKKIGISVSDTSGTQLFLGDIVQTWFLEFMLQLTFLRHIPYAALAVNAAFIKSPSNIKSHHSSLDDNKA